MRQDQIVNKYIYAFFILLLGVFLFLGVKEFFSAFLGSIVFYTLFKRFMLYLTGTKRVKKNLAAVIIIIISFIIVVLPVGVLVSVLYNKISALTADPQLIQQNIAKFTTRLNHLPFKVNTQQLENSFKTAISSNIGSFLNSSLAILASILMMYFFLFFMLINAKGMESSIVNFLPFRRSKIVVFGKELRDQTVSNAIGVPLVCVAQGIAAYIAYRIAGVPEAGLWATLTGFASVIPLVGTGIIWIPVVGFLLIENHTWQGVFVAAYSILIMSNVDNLIRMVVSNKIGHVHPVITVLGIIMGLKFFGLPGLVFGPLLISYFFILLRLFHTEYSKAPEVAPQPVQEKRVVDFIRNQFSLFSTNPKKPDSENKGSGLPPI